MKICKLSHLEKLVEKEGTGTGREAGQNEGAFRN